MVLLMIFLLHCKEVKTGDNTDSGGVMRHYYVSPQGRDTGAGTRQKPLQSLSRALDKLQPGDTLTLLAGTYNIGREIIIRCRGEKGKHIVLEGEPGHTVVIDAGKVNIPNDPEYPYTRGALQIEDAAYLVLRDITVQNSHMAAININRSHHIDIVNCNTENSFASGLSAWQGCTHIRFLGNRVVNANDPQWSLSTVSKRGAPHEAISMAGPHYFEVAWNLVEDCKKEGIDVKETASHGTVHHNYVHDCARQGLYADSWFGVLEDVSFHHNVVTRCEAGIAVSAENGPVTRNIRIHHNLVFENRAAGVFLSRWGRDNKREDIKICNNTFYRNGRGKPAKNSTFYWLAGGCYLYSLNLENIIIENNIFSEDVPFEIGYSSKYRPDDFEKKKITIAWNLIHNTNEVSSPVYLAEWARDSVYATTGDSAVLAAPLFADPAHGDFRLKADSPARHAGDPDPGYSNPDGSRNDIGAFPAGGEEPYFWWKEDFPPLIQVEKDSVYVNDNTDRKKT